MTRNRPQRIAWMLIAVVAVLILGSVVANAQTDPCPQMPDGYLCIPRAVAVKALEDADVRAALEKRLQAEETARAALKDELAIMRAEFARASGENTILKQRAVSDAALIELLTKMVRPKRIGLINLF